MLNRFFTGSIYAANATLTNSAPISNFFVISLGYLVPITTVEHHLPAHREFLDRGYREGVFIASGRKVPRTGGVILALAESKKALEDLINCDPFKIHGVAEYSIMEFEPGRYCDGLANLVEGSARKNKI